MRILLLAVALSLALAAPASAGDPILPLSQVSKGMRCSVLSVLQGTEISSFRAEVVDVVAGDAADDQPRILVRLSGENIERTGVGPGFSGSPIYCPDRDGTEKVAGAISESVNEFGGLLALATPIEAVIGQQVEPPVGRQPAKGPPRDRRRELAAPLSLGGLSPTVGRLFSRAAQRAGRVLYASPARPRAASFPVQQLRPGSAMAAGLASGDITAGAVGTVAYVDGDRVWAFGHPLDGAGRRSLFLQDAYVFAVVNNPVQVEGLATYKLAAPGHDVGILSGDGLSAVAGRLGRLPDRFPMQVSAVDQDTGRTRVHNVRIADENALALPTGTSALALAGGAAIGEAATTILNAAPARQTGEMCVQIGLRERPKAPLRFCNRYVVRGGGEEEGGLGVGAPMAADFVQAVTALDEFNFGTLRVTDVGVKLKLRRGLRQAFLLRGRGPATVRRGSTARIRVRVQEVRGEPTTRTIRVPVPRGMPRGERLLTLEGAPADTGGDVEVDLAELLFGADPSGADSEGGDEAGPRTVSALARLVSKIGRYDGVLASFDPTDADELAIEDGIDVEGAEGIARRPREVLRDPRLRLSGRVRIPVVVE